MFTTGNIADANATSTAVIDRHTIDLPLNATRGQGKAREYSLQDAITVCVVVDAMNRGYSREQSIELGHTLLPLLQEVVVNEHVEQVLVGRPDKNSLTSWKFDVTTDPAEALDLVSQNSASIVFRAAPLVRRAFVALGLSKKVPA